MIALKLRVGQLSPDLALGGALLLVVVGDVAGLVLN
jgi:hypothetical protein